MNNNLKYYKIKLTTQSPLYIGSGQAINKKEYIYVREEKRVYIPNINKMYKFFVDNRLAKSFEEYMLSGYISFENWLKTNGINKAKFLKFCDYSLDIGDIDFSKKEIKCFIKDAYNMPYIPASSLKGALRTIVLTNMITQNRGNYVVHKKNIIHPQCNNKIAYEKEGKDIEKFNLFKTVIDGEDKERRDFFAGLKISDSKPINQDRLTLCQKVDFSIRQNENKINLLRECIIPNTEIEFKMTIDTNILPFTHNYILSSVKVFNEEYTKNFKSNFTKSSKVMPNIFYLGGGTGYATKTITHTLLENNLREVSKVVDNVSSHNHKVDKDIGVTPRVIKLTHYGGKRVQMGACKIEINEILP